MTQKCFCLFKNVKVTADLHICGTPDILGGIILKSGLGQWFKKAFHYLVHGVIIPNVIWAVLLSIPATGIYIWKLVMELATNETLPHNYFVIFLCAIGGAVVLVIIDIVYLVRYYSSKKCRPSFPELTFDYKVSDAEYELYFIDRTHIVQTQAINMVALKDGLENIDHRMGWTGQTYVGSSLTDKCRGITLTDTTKSTFPLCVSINFNKPLKRGERAFYEFESKVEDPTCSMVPFLAKAIKCETDKIRIKVTAPRGMIKKANGCVYADGMRQIRLKEPVVIYSNRAGACDVFEWEIEQLELLRYYSLEWEFA